MPHPAATARLAGLGIALILAGASIGDARSQDQDAVSMRLDRLEQGLNDVQRQLNNGAAAPSGADSGTPSPAPASGSQALATEVRISNLESQMRDLTGQLEEIQFGVTQVKNRLDKMQADDEQRFHALEHPGSGPADTAAPPPSAGDATPSGTPPDNSGGPTPIAPGASSGDMSQAPSASGSLSAPGSASADSGAAAAPDQTAAAPKVELPAGTPESQYAYAFNLVRQNDFPGAESAFKQFLDQNPKDPLAGNAQYWLGETYFARNQFQQAAAIFAQGYVKYPKSEKTPNVLLSLGISLGNLGKKQQACLSFAKLEHQFPNMHQNIKDMTRTQKKRLGCGS
jgi:tol-pal system protein YbgF